MTPWYDDTMHSCLLLSTKRLKTPIFHIFAHAQVHYLKIEKLQSQGYAKIYVMKACLQL